MSATTGKGQERHKGRRRTVPPALRRRNSSKRHWPSHGQCFNVISLSSAATAAFAASTC